MQNDIITVNQLNQNVKGLLEGQMGYVWVEGELSNVARPPSGHIYFTLKDDKAQVRCAMFRGFLKGKNDWQQGMQVVVRARVSLYAPRGDYQLIVEQMTESGLGALQQAFEALKIKLEKEGLFADTHKKELPETPKCLGVVTSPTGAAIHDILHVIEKRYPAVPIIVYPTLVQGNEAAKNIVHAIELAQKHKRCDVLIVGRGGGSLEDLWPFNEEIVARAIYKCKIPIVSAVGHETDFSISDFVADVRAPTPSAAAALVTPDGESLLAYVIQQRRTLQKDMLRMLNDYEQTVSYLAKRLTHPGRQIQYCAQRLDDLWLRMQQAIQFNLQSAEQSFLTLTRALDALSPLAILNRGYSITMNRDGDIIQKATQVKVGDTLTTKLGKGMLESTVVKKG